MKSIIQLLIVFSGLFIFSNSAFALEEESRAGQLFNLSSLQPAVSASAAQTESQTISGRSQELQSTPTLGSLQKKMILFDFKDDFECPLFSNSPYVEALESIETMQSQINRMVPSCDQDQQSAARVEELKLSSQKFRDRILDAQKLQKTGLTTQFNSVVRDIVSQANRLQSVLTEAIHAPASVCMKSNQAERRQVIFQINDAFQSLAPVVLDLVSKSPGLATVLAPSLKAVIGAEAISRNISLFEKLIRESQMFDMKDSKSRINTIKNVCQFMKLYRRLSYLRMSRLEEVQKITASYDAEIRKLKERVTKMELDSKQNTVVPVRAAAAPRMGESTGGFRPLNAGMAMASSADPMLDAYMKLSDLKIGVDYSAIQLKGAIEFVDQMKTKLSRPEISQCQIIRKELTRIETERNLQSIHVLSLALSNLQVQRMLEGVQAYFDRLIKMNHSDSSTLGECVQLGSDWLISMIEVFDASDSLIKQYEDRLISTEQGKLLKAKRDLKRKSLEVTNKENELSHIKTMINVAAFESSEVDKNAKGLYRFFLGGPDWDEISSDSFTKRFSVWVVNEGPVYSLLKNTEGSFLFALEEVNRALGKIQNFERYESLKKYNNKIPQDHKSFSEWYALDILWKKELPHILPENFPVGSHKHKLVCENAALAVDYYIQAANHLASSESLCRMVKPALKESEVSKALKSYCEVMPGSSWRNTRQDAISKIDQMKMKVVEGDIPVAATVDYLLKRMQNFGCENIQ